MQEYPLSYTSSLNIDFTVQEKFLSEGSIVVAKRFFLYHVV